MALCALALLTAPLPVLADAGEDDESPRPTIDLLQVLSTDAPPASEEEEDYNSDPRLYAKQCVLLGRDVVASATPTKAGALSFRDCGAILSRSENIVGATTYTGCLQRCVSRMIDKYRQDGPFDLTDGSVPDLELCWDLAYGWPGKPKPAFCSVGEDLSLNTDRSEAFSAKGEPSERETAPRAEIHEIDPPADSAGHTAPRSADNAPLASILLAAAEVGDSALVSLLLDQGLDPDTADANRWSPLMYASFGAGRRGQHLDVARQLLARGARPDVIDGEGNSPLSIAVASGASSEYVSLLLEAGADPKAKNALGQTAADIAAIHGTSLPDSAVVSPVLSFSGGQDLFYGAVGEMTASDWRRVQGKLAALGLYRAAIDGKPGRRTRLAVAAFLSVYFDELRGRADAACNLAINGQMGTSGVMLGRVGDFYGEVLSGMPNGYGCLLDRDAGSRTMLHADLGIPTELIDNDGVDIVLRKTFDSRDTIDWTMANLLAYAASRVSIRFARSDESFAMTPF